MAKTTKEQLLTAFTNAKNISSLPSFEGTKLAYAAKRFTDLNENIVKEIQDEITDIYTSLASVDDRGNIIKDEKGVVSMTIENTKQSNTKIKELYAQEVEYKPFKVKDTDPSLSKLHKSFEVLKGFLFDCSLYGEIDESEFITE